MATKFGAGLLVVSIALFGSAAWAAPADTVFLNGKVFTADATSSVVQAFAVAGGKFVGVGTTAAVKAGFVRHATKVIDLKGSFVSPGLCDNHFHNEGGGDNIDLSHVRSLPELLAVIGNAVAMAKPDQVLRTNSDWHEAQLKEQRLPLAIEIDRVAPNTPVIIVRGGHSIILNTAALKKYNITKDTPAPPGGQISRDDKGELTGELFDNAKSLVQLPAGKPVGMADIMATQQALNPYGITAVRIPGSYKGDLVQALALMKEAEARGSLNLRYTVYMPGFAFRSADQVAPAIESWNVKMDQGDDMIRVEGVKLIVDGGFEGGHLSTAYKEPYGKGGTFYGLTVVPQAGYTAVVRELNKMGWRVTTHAVGDAAVDEVLNAYEAANADSSIIGKRWSIEHAFVTRPEQLVRMKDLGLYLSVQDHLYLAAPSLKKYWGMEVAENVTPLKTYLASGLPVSLGSDSPVIPYNPFFILYHFMTRDTISDGIYGSKEAVPSRTELLKDMTINYAKLIGEENIKGSIEPGKLADFAVLTHDFLTVPAKDIPKMKALATYLGGREVYRDPTFK
jgi:predicted amidohydrolase YtcJ